MFWAAAAAVLIGVLIALPWESEVDTQLVRDTTYDLEGPNAPYENAAYTRTTEGIDSHGTRLDAWVYVPKGLPKRVAVGSCEDSEQFT